MVFGNSINNCLLQVAVSAGEATIRHACGNAPVEIYVDLQQFLDGRDAIHVNVRAPEGESDFTMLLRNYFIRPVLWRVARRAWGRRTSAGLESSRMLDCESPERLQCLN